MSRFADFFKLTVGVSCLVLVGCKSGGVGDPCIPEDEYSPTFSGFSETQVNVESKSFQCETRICLVEHFRGRVSCPYGQEANGGKCRIPGGAENEVVTAAVPAQLLERPWEDAVYCSCRCKGPDPSARYCECPADYVCQELIDNIGKDLGVGLTQLAGSYCVKNGKYRKDPMAISKVECSGTACGEPYQGTYPSN